MPPLPGRAPAAPLGGGKEIARRAIYEYRGNINKKNGLDELMIRRKDNSDGSGRRNLPLSKSRRSPPTDKQGNDQNERKCKK